MSYINNKHEPNIVILDIFGDNVPDMEHLDGKDELRFNHFYMTFVHVLKLYTRSCDITWIPTLILQ